MLFSGDRYEGGRVVGDDGSIAGVRSNRVDCFCPCLAVVGGSCITRLVNPLHFRYHPSRQGHVTNYAQNKDGEVWSLSQLESYLGPQHFSELHGRIIRNVAMTYAAALGPMRKEAERLSSLHPPIPRPSHPASPASTSMPSLLAPAGSGFELMGLDFLVDDQLNPWLLEVNSTPSLAVEHSDPKGDGAVGLGEWHAIWKQKRATMGMSLRVESGGHHAIIPMN